MEELWARNKRLYLRHPDAKPKLKRKEYEEQIAKLHVELVKLQFWAKRTGARIIVLFEGRDAAGKGGVIKRITERVSPRVFRVIALSSPSERSAHKFTFSDISNIFRRREKSSFLTGVGITVPVLNESWGFVQTINTNDSSRYARPGKMISSAPASL